MKNRLKMIAVLLTLTLLCTLVLCACGEKSKLETAQSMRGEPLDALISAIGEPERSSYASSCIGDGEDGELYYDGFTVYTYRDTDGTESVQDVMPAQ